MVVQVQFVLVEKPINPLSICLRYISRAIEIICPFSLYEIPYRVQSRDFRRNEAASQSLERDRQFFNTNEKKELYTVYEKGKVALLITRKEKKYLHDLWIYIEYRDVKPAQVFYKSTKPKRAKKSDF